MLFHNLSKIIRGHHCYRDGVLLFQEVFQQNFYTMMTDEYLDWFLCVRFWYLYYQLWRGKPLAYVIEKKHFRGLSLMVNRNVLIPRNETEQLVDIVLREREHFRQPRILDLCTGSGCLALSLKQEIPESTVVASDISFKALEIACINAQKNKLLCRWVCSDYLQEFVEKGEKFDIIVSNPPYIDRNYPLERSVIDYEPHLALFADHQGLEAYQRIFPDLTKVLSKQFLIVMEIGFDQKIAIMKLAKTFFDANTTDITVLRDYAGQDRFVVIKSN